MKDTNTGGLRIDRSGRERVRTLRLIRVAVAGAALGFLLPRATIYGGSAPFGLGLAAAMEGPAAIPVFFCTVVGYLLCGQAGTLRYLAALVTILGLRWAVSGFPRMIRSSWFAPITTFISALITGSAMLLTDSRSLTDVIILVCECLLAAGFAHFCRSFFASLSRDDSLRGDPTLSLSSMLMVAVSAMALFDLQWQDISAGRILAVLFILLGAHCGGVKGGCLAGCLFGMSAFISDPALLYLVPVYACGGLLSGFFSAKGHIASSLIFAAVNSIVFAIYAEEINVHFVIGLYEIAAAAVFLFLIPGRIKRVIRGLFADRPKEPAAREAREMVAEKMALAAGTMQSVAGTVDEVSKRLATVGSPSLSSLYLSVSDAVCRGCCSRISCWEQHCGEIMDSFNGLIPILTEKGTISADDVQGYLKTSCDKLPNLCTQLNLSYKEYLIRTEAFHRLQELRAVVNDQFENTARILAEFSEQFNRPQWHDSEMAERIEERLNTDGWPVERVVCRIMAGSHAEVELHVHDICTPEDSERLCSLVEKCCERIFAEPQIERIGENTIVLLTEGQHFRLRIAAAQSKCEGEKLCGDAYEVLRDHDGMQFVVLSDGMGCGGRAAVDGAMAAGLTAELLKAGFGYESILRVVNTALMAKSAEETLATLDIACIDLFTGELEILKAGAGVSLLLSKGHISRIDDSSLPLGILRELTFARTRDRLVEGDLLLMMSDGISNDGTAWIEDLLRKNEGEPQQLADTIISTACRLHKGEKGDDMTVIIIRLEKTDLDL